MTQAATRQSYPAAELDRRFYAFAIDRLLAWGVYAGAAYAAYRFLIEPGDTWAGIGVIAGVVLVVGLIFAVALGVAGVSPGKALVGLRVVRHEAGRPIGIPAAMLRTIVLGVAALPTFGLGVATLAWTAVMDGSGRRRGAHDRMSGAVVVDIRPQPEPEEEVDERPRQIVNLTAMRLMPSPPEQPLETPAPAPTPAPTPAPAPAPEPAQEPLPPAQPRPEVLEPAPALPTPASGRHAGPPAAPPSARPVPDYPPPPPSAVPGQPIATQRRVDTTAQPAI
ncbi:MAG TPA: RDD family protein, partial [Nocardioides sp.]|nr:RDD family protein [Nocardioides sp.]